MRNSIAKPFRFLSIADWRNIQTRLTTAIELWNQTHAKIKLNFERNLIYFPQIKDKFLHFYDNNKLVACSEPSFLSLMQEAHFGQCAECFTPANHALSAKFIQSLIGAASLNLEEDEFNAALWHYPGSPMVSIKLNLLHQSCYLYFHPSWVLEHLNKRATPKIKTPLSTALNPTQIETFVTLPNLSLSLANLKELQLGDILKTEHRIINPLELKFKNATIALADLGAQKAHKAIKIRKPL